MKVAIVGCGHVASQHIRQLKKMSEIHIVGVCDQDSLKAADYANQVGLKKHFTNINQLLSECKPDCVHILTPPQTHKDLTINCIEAGCHVLVEKPMALNSTETSQMIAASESAKVKLSVCHNFLFIPALIEAKKMAREDDFGEIVYAEVFWRISRKGLNDRYHQAKWMYDLPGGIAHEIAAHPVYLLKSFLGDLNVRGVSKMNRATDLPQLVQDLQVLLESKTALANIAISVNSQPAEKFLRILGTKSSAYIDLGSNTLIKLKPIGQGGINKAMANFNHASQYINQTVKNIFLSSLGRLPHGHETLIKLFYSFLNGEIENPASGKEGHDVVATLDRIWNYKFEEK